MSITIKTGKRTWNLTITGELEKGQRILVSNSGLTYWLSADGRTMTGRNRKQTRTYTWLVTNDKDVKAQLTTVQRQAEAKLAA
ncbi:MAG: hypothetical protein AAF449_10855 [Myxococcota bacterium]